MNTNETNQPMKSQSKLDQAAAGLASSNLSLLNSLVILGVSVAKADIITRLKTTSALYANVLATRHAYEAAVNARNAGVAQFSPFYASFVLALRQALGPVNMGLLPIFGLEVPKARQQPSAETKALARAKAKATRAARGVMSKKERQAIPAATGVTLQLGAPAAPPVSGEASSSSTPSSTVTPSAPSSTASKPTP